MLFSRRACSISTTQSTQTQTSDVRTRRGAAMRQRRRGAQSREKSATEARTQSARDLSQIRGPLPQVPQVPQAPQVPQVRPRPLGPPRPPAPPSPRARPSSSPAAPSPACGASAGGHSPGRGGSRTGAGLGAEGTHRAAGKGLPCRQRRGGRASELVAERRRTRDGGGEERFPKSLLLPTSSRARERARGAALGRGQRFFVSPALLARHCGGPHPGRVDGRSVRDKLL